MSSTRALDREIARLAVPAFGALVAQPLYVLADVAIVGRQLGETQLAGLAIASAALATGFAVFIFLAYGTTAAVSRLLGAGDLAEAAAQAVQSLWLAGLLGVLVGAGVGVLAEPLVVGLGASGDVVEPARTYLRVSALGIPAQLLVFAGTGYLRGLQDTRTPLVVAVVASVGNAVVELALIVGLDQGIWASAASTVMAETGSAVVYVALILRAVRRMGVTLRPDPARLRRLAVVGADLVVRTLALRVALTVATAVAARIGTSAVAAHEVAFAVWGLLALALDALAIAGQALVGRALGAGDPAAAELAGDRLLRLGVVGGVVVGGVVAALSGVLPQAFLPPGPTAALAGVLLLWVAVLQPVNALAFVLDGLLIGAEDFRFLAAAMVGAGVVLAALAVGVLQGGLDVVWLWAAIGVFMVARAVPLGLRWRSRAWLSS